MSRSTPAGAGIGIFIAASCLLASACATRRQPETVSRYAADGAVSAEVVESASITRYETGNGSTWWSGGEPTSGNPTPEYPSALLARLLPPVTVDVQVVVEKSGAVTGTTITNSTSVEPAFGDAVLTAMAKWKFEPLLRMSVEKMEALPFSQQYRFTFRQLNGRAIVETVDSRPR